MISNLCHEDDDRKASSLVVTPKHHLEEARTEAKTEQCTLYRVLQSILGHVMDCSVPHPTTTGEHAWLW